jgi:hypothetical protein
MFFSLAAVYPRLVRYSAIASSSAAHKICGRSRPGFAGATRMLVAT